jgi:hypothetical protein
VSDPVQGEVVEGSALPAARPKRALPPVPPVRLSPVARRNVDTSLQNFEDSLGGREKMVDALSLGARGSIAEDRAQFILGLLADPRHKGKSLRRLAKLAGISLEDLLALYRESTVMKAHLQAIGTIASGLPGVAADVMRKSVPYEETCYTCSGTSEITPEPTKKNPNPGPEKCRTCRGLGRLLHQPDLETQKLALTLGGLVKGGAGGLTVNVNQQQAQQAPQGQVPYTAGEGLLQLQKLSESALYGNARGSAGTSGRSTPPAEEGE